jgi:hypothetical protein
VTLGGKQYRICDDGKVYGTDGGVLCQSGGRTCLDGLLAPKCELVTLGGQQYRICDDGKVFGPGGNEICSSGGRPCLDKHLLKGQAYFIYVVNGQSYAIYISNNNGINGMVVDQNDNVVCQSGGAECLLRSGRVSLLAEMSEVATSYFNYQSASLVVLLAVAVAGALHLNKKRQLEKIYSSANGESLSYKLL